MTVGIILQARMSSTRLPGKVLRPLNGKPMLELILDRLKLSSKPDLIIVATTDTISDVPIRNQCSSWGVACYAGNELDVLDRFYHAAKEYDLSIIVRATADNPFVDPSIIDEAVDYFQSSPDLQYVHYHDGLPLGCAVEVFDFKALEKAWKQAEDMECREHVTPYLYNPENGFSWEKHHSVGCDYSQYRFTVDEISDFQTVESIFEGITKPDEKITFSDAISFINRNPDIVANKAVCQKSIRYGVH